MPCASDFFLPDPLYSFVCLHRPGNRKLGNNKPPPAFGDSDVQQLLSTVCRKTRTETSAGWVMFILIICILRGRLQALQRVVTHFDRVTAREKMHESRLRSNSDIEVRSPALHKDHERVSARPRARTGSRRHSADDATSQNSPAPSRLFVKRNPPIPSPATRSCPNGVPKEQKSVTKERVEAAASAMIDSPVPAPSVKLQKARSRRQRGKQDQSATNHKKDEGSASRRPMRRSKRLQLLEARRARAERRISNVGGARDLSQIRNRLRASIDAIQ